MNHLKKLISPELKLAALLSKPTMTASQIGQSLELINSIDITRFRALLDQHRIWPCVYINIRDHFVTLFPDDLLAYLHKKFQQNIYLSSQHFITYGELLHLFKSADIPVRTLKGIPLAKKLYGDIVKRHSHDIDLIIPADQINKAHEKLINSGYRCEIYDQLPKHQQPIYFKALKDIIYTSKTGVMLELHVRPCQYPTLLSKHYTRQIFNNTALEDQSNYELIYLCWHGTQSFYHRLKWLVDVAIYIEQMETHNQLNVDSLVLSAKQLDSMRSLCISWVLANSLYGTPLPLPIRDFYHQDRVTRIFIKKSLKVLDMSENSTVERLGYEAFIYARLLPQDWSEKRLLIMELLTPTVNDIKLLSAIPAKLILMYYLMRPLTLFYRRLRPDKT